jgi:Gpi18-like mannosyltransferase
VFQSVLNSVLDQGFLFSILQSHNVIKATTYWTATNVADGLQALCTCVEVRILLTLPLLTYLNHTLQMVFFSALMLWSFSSKDYRAMRKGRPHTNSFKAFFHSQNYWDFIRDTGLALKFFFDTLLRRSYINPAEPDGFDTAFGVHRSGTY